ncbi:uncharacterized protein [Cardiocondyla obscurior]|uniref:uncharacterized protein n=1 Tax=Cardiocondyla obscurior TaxID=286306 RepID=UPI0039656647
MFVVNRVAEVQSILPANHWHHVDGKVNPADLISRGVSVNNLKHSKVWWSGPAWLSHRTECEKRISGAVPVSGTDERIMLAERGSGARVLVSVGNSEDVRLALLTEHSSLSRVKRILAWMNRFIGNSRADLKDRAFGNLSLGKLRRAHQSLIIAVQGLHFAEELSQLSSGKRIPASSNLLSTDLFVDKEGVLRVGGRIENSSLSVTQKYPIILPSSSRLTRLLFERMHRRLLHAGP